MTRHHDEEMDTAIEHFASVARDMRTELNAIVDGMGDDMAEEHRMLHDWLVELRGLRRIVNEAGKAANNALYFDDSSDYRSALVEILEKIMPEADVMNLQYIEDEDG